MDKLNTLFKKLYHQNPMITVRAPGRVNLIGEHTDYNHGFVLPIAINLELSILASPRSDQQVVIYSCDFQEKKKFSLDDFKSSQGDQWLAYVKGMAHVLQKQFSALKGFNAIIQSAIPRGAGLSSSAALELGIAYLFSIASSLKWQPVLMAQLAQQAENEWVGVNCGIMDQLSIATGKKGFASLIDCRDLSIQNVPVSHELAIVIMDTTTRRGLVSSAYNERRRQCEMVAKKLNVNSLRDVSLSCLKKNGKLFSEVCFNRAHHVLTENDRVIKSCEALQKNDYTKLGQLLNESHESLQHDFEVSSNHLNLMVKCAQAFPSCYGARMTGAGFGGCAVALVKATDAEDFKQFVQEKYQALTTMQPAIYITQAVDGVGLREEKAVG